MTLSNKMKKYNLNNYKNKPISTQIKLKILRYS